MPATTSQAHSTGATAVRRHPGGAGAHDGAQRAANASLRDLVASMLSDDDAQALPGGIDGLAPGPAAADDAPTAAATDDEVQDATGTTAIATAPWTDGITPRPTPIASRERPGPARASRADTPADAPARRLDRTLGTVGAGAPAIDEAAAGPDGAPEGRATATAPGSGAPVDAGRIDPSRAADPGAARATAGQGPIPARLSVPEPAAPKLAPAAPKLAPGVADAGPAATGAATQVPAASANVARLAASDTPQPRVARPARPAPAGPTQRADANPATAERSAFAETPGAAGVAPGRPNAAGERERERFEAAGQKPATDAPATSLTTAGPAPAGPGVGLDPSTPRDAGFGVPFTQAPASTPAGTAPAATAAALPGLLLASSPGDATFGADFADRITSLAITGAREARIELNPALLGPISIEIDLDDDDGLSIAIDASHPQTRAAIEQSIGTLRDTLADKGMRMNEWSLGGGAMQDGGGTGSRDGSHAGTDARSAALPTPSDARSTVDATAASLHIGARPWGNARARPGDERSGRVDLYA